MTLPEANSYVLSQCVSVELAPASIILSIIMVVQNCGGFYANLIVRAYGGNYYQRVRTIVLREESGRCLNYKKILVSELFISH